MSNSNPLKRRAMIWILLFTVMAYSFAMLPFLYSFKLHGAKQIGSIWGYSPASFLFNSTFYPFVAFFIIYAVRILVIDIEPQIAPGNPFKSWLLNWPTYFLLTGMLGCSITLASYYYTPWAVDKLKPTYAKRSVSAMKAFNDKVVDSNLSTEERDAYRKKLIRQAKLRLSEHYPQAPYFADSNRTSQWIETLDDEEFLQAANSKAYQVPLRMVDPAMLFLANLQVASQLLVALTVFILVGIILYLTKNNPHLHHLSQLNDATFWAVFYCTFYSILFHIYTQQRAEVAGETTMIKQDLFAGLATLGLLWVLKSSHPGNTSGVWQEIQKFIPVGIAGILTGGSIFGLIAKDTLRSLLGSDTNMGVQFMIIIVTLMFSIGPVLQVVLEK